MIGWWRKRRRREAELAEEIGSHFRLAVEDRMAHGATREQALAAAHREFGSEVLVREVTRSQWSGAAFESILREFALALRALRRNRRFTVAAVLCVALGIGVTMTVFAALHAVLLRPLPYANAAELVWLRAQHSTRAETGATITPEVLAAWRQSTSLEELGTWRSGTTDLTGGDQLPERAASALVTANLFPLLGTAPQLGRWFSAEEEAEGASDVVLLGHELWRSRFGGDTSLVGASLELYGRPYRVVGVMPEGFSFPEGARLWMPLAPPPLPPGVLFYDGAVGRRAVGASVADVRDNVAATMSGLRADGAYEGWDFTVELLHDGLVAPLRRPILIFQGAALLVLLLACANVGALLLARSASRRQELAVRAALGAGRGRLVQHVLVECLVLAALGGIVGTVLAWAGVRLLTLAFPDGVPSYIDLNMHVPVLVFALVLTLAAAVLFGLAPALLARRLRPDLALSGVARGRNGTPGRGRGTLVAAQLAVSVVLLASAALLVRSHTALERSLGFEHAGVLTIGVELPHQRYAESDHRVAFEGRARHALAGLSAVTAVSSAVTAPPLQDGTSGGMWEFRVVGGEGASPAGEREQRAVLHYVSPGFIDVLGVPVVAGRDISAADALAGDVTAVVNETFARRYFPGDDAVGQRIEIEYADNEWGGAWRIVGVARDFRHAPPPAELQPAVYVQQGPGAGRLTFLLHTRLPDASVLGPAVRRVMRDIDPALPVRIVAQTDVVERAFWRQRLQRNVIMTFAVLATALALFGVYGVLSYAVAQRTPELGVRLALGASPRRLLLHVLGYAARLAVAGVVTGLAASLALTRLLRGLLYGVEPTDPLMLGGAALALLCVALCAAAVPAWRASRVDPQAAMRSGG